MNRHISGTDDLRATTDLAAAIMVDNERLGARIYQLTTYCVVRGYHWRIIRTPDDTEVTVTVGTTGAIVTVTLDADMYTAIDTAAAMVAGRPLP